MVIKLAAIGSGSSATAAATLPRHNQRFIANLSSDGYLSSLAIGDHQRLRRQNEQADTERRQKRDDQHERPPYLGDHA